MFPNTLLTFLKTQQYIVINNKTEPISFVSVFKVKTLVRKKLRLISHKVTTMHEIICNKYIHSIGHWKNQSIVPINSWKSNHVKDAVLTKKVWERIQKIAILKQLQTHSKQNLKKVWERRSHAFPPHYTPEPRRTLECRRSTFYQHSQCLERLLVHRETKTWKNQEQIFEHKLSQNLQFWHLLHSILDE